MSMMVQRFVLTNHFDLLVTLFQDYFSVINDTGDIIVANGPIDRETAEVVELTVHVRDMNALPAFGEQTATGKGYHLTS